jgi:transitional endoplasmic reticulum ATPase
LLKENAMRWGTVINAITAKSQEACVDPQELLLAQMVAVRLVLIQAYNNSSMDEDEWQQLFGWLGLRPPKDIAKPPFGTYRPSLKRWLKKAVTKVSPEQPVDCMLAHLVSHIAELLQLDDVEQQLLLLAWLRRRHQTMSPVMVSIEASHATRVLSLLLGHSSDAIHSRLRESGRLRMLELVGNRPSFMDLDDVLQSGSLLDILAPLASQELDYQQSEVIKQAVSSRLVSLCPPLPAAQFPLSSFSQVPMRQLLLDYLRLALQENRRGANVLIHGQPGVGKTELIKTLATQLGTPLYGVPVAEKDHSPISPSRRLARYRVVQELLDKQPALVMFDEIEDVMNDEEALPKGWTNQLLENNPLPGIWVSNSVRWLDPAYRRRFDLIIEVKASSGPTALQHYQQLLAEMPVTEPARERLAAQPWMTPAMARQLTRLAPLFNQRTPLRNERQLVQLLSDRLQAQGMTSATKGLLETHGASHNGPKMPDYRMEWLNTDPGLEHILKRLERRGRGRLCLHGLPGSGKTAMAAHLAKALGRELITAHASSLMDKYVGGTEEKIAELFQRARDKQAVLLLDEVDSLLLNRDGASHSWEISHTNELLVQLENFDGILLATTNRHDSLDPAVMRRFDLKVTFHPLAPTQLRELLKAVLPARDHARLDAIPEQQLASRRLTPGNVRTALDQLDLRGLPVRLNTLMEALEQEEREQCGSKRPMGFF